MSIKVIEATGIFAERTESGRIVIGMTLEGGQTVVVRGLDPKTAAWFGHDVQAQAMPLALPENERR